MRLGNPDHAFVNPLQGRDGVASVLYATTNYRIYKIKLTEIKIS